MIEMMMNLTLANDMEYNDNALIVQINKLWLAGL